MGIDAQHTGFPQQNHEEHTAVFPVTQMSARRNEGVTSDPVMGRNNFMVEFVVMQPLITLCVETGFILMSDWKNGHQLI
jgi:hypothetical protein